MTLGELKKALNNLPNSDNEKITIYLSSDKRGNNSYNINRVSDYYGATISI